MGISFRIIRNLLASRLLLILAPIMALLPWGILVWVNTTHGVEQVNQSVAQTLKESVRGCTIRFEKLEVDPTKSLFIEELSITDERGDKILSMPKFKLKWILWMEPKTA